MIHASHLKVVEFMSGGVELQTAGWQLLEVRAQVLVRQANTGETDRLTQVRQTG